MMICLSSLSYVRRLADDSSGKEKKAGSKQCSLYSRTRSLCFVLMWNFWGLPQVFPYCPQEEAQLLGMVVRPFTTWPTLSSCLISYLHFPTRSSHTGLCLVWKHSKHTHHVHSPLPSPAFSLWASSHLLKLGSDITSVKPFLTLLRTHDFCLPALFQGPPHCIAHSFSIFLSKERAP